MDPSRHDPLRPDIWPSCGYRLLSVDEAGRLLATETFLRHFLQRPELAPVTESCSRERALHQSLLDEPERPVSSAQLAQLADPDARENYQFALAFRDLLLRHPSLEEAYLALVSGRDAVTLPGPLLELLVQLLVRHILADPATDGYQCRAAELLFRPQQVSLESGVVVADAGYLQRHRRPQALNVLETLIHQAGGVAADGTARPTLELLNEHTLAHYRGHSESRDLALGLNLSGPGLEALCRVLERWLRHFHDVAVRITPLSQVNDSHWRWHVGLDATGTDLLNRLYLDGDLDDDEQRLLLGLFRLDFEDVERIRPDLADYPVYLAMAMTPERELRLKPQNLLLNLPLADAS